MKPRQKNWKPERHACILFNCDHRHGHFCCRECSRRRECSNPCQNTTDRCGYHRPTVEASDKTKEAQT